MTFCNNTDKNSILYDVISFSIITICLSSILYCLIVRVENYCYPLLIGFMFVSILLCIIASKFHSKRNSKFDELTNAISIEVIKQTLKTIFAYLYLSLFWLLFLYPLLEFIFWILSTFFPKWWPEIYSVNWITDFAIKYLPYSFHPNCTPFAFFMTNFLCLLIFSKIATGGYYYLGGFLGGILFYSFFDEQLFDGIATFAGLIGTIVILVLILFVLAAGGGSSSSSCSSSSYNHENHDNSFSANSSSSFSDTTPKSSSNVNSLSNCERKTTRQTQQKSISYVIQHGNDVCVYGEDRMTLFRKRGELQGYTSNSVTIKINNRLCVYRPDGSIITTKQA